MHATTPMDKLRALLPVNYGLTEELEKTIKFTYSSRLLTIDNEADAIDLYMTANNHPRMSTRALLEEDNDLAIDGDFEFNLASAKATLIRAFSKSSGTPYLLKFGSETLVEIENFRKLNFSSDEESFANYVVPLKLISTLDHKPALLLPVMYCSLDIVPN
jgi:hypothetical protein